ncbi:UDP-N-acetylmuramoyl-L-alanine--D-glutamate ligase [Corynebacterium sp. NML130628]|uniref:UDP-N-acetylmuramoyl-L-alanine--D-glutamate ligase n=1 Tax=Corynebacterium sp. NML130628 TaxID=1906333 RepID=UPI0008FBAF4D|nr:UDP-N-acetylmuramoyl-L-alanine--D-glutamate ligase [Corynebacterium sp. NML130628]OIR45373.1 UDP-N-acetylmuramoylalanine--D-glutamate ligase [Corynebacterium sp. NML130628]
MIDSSVIPGEISKGVLLAGAGVSGRGVLAMLAQIGVECIVADDSDANREFAESTWGVTAIDTQQAHEYFDKVGVVVTSPGWRPDTPLLIDATKAQLDVIGDVELCYRLDRAGVFGQPREWLVVTGTNGKTTTTGMLAAMMQAASARTGKRALACGNIGTAVADAVSDTDRVDVLVAELSSFQLHWSSQLVPDAAVLLNLADDHIDWHGSFQAYADAKAKVLHAPDAVVGIDDEHVRTLVTQRADKKFFGFTLGEPREGEVGVINGTLVARRDGALLELAATDGIEPAGAAGVLDAGAAASVALLRGVTPEEIREALAHFHVAGHRGAVVHGANGVRWIDNSKATNPHAADSALTGAGTVVWVAGGQLKGAAIDEVVEKHVGHMRAVALLGVDRMEIYDAVKRLAPELPIFVTDSTDPDAAMDAVVRFAGEQAKPGDSVVLAPAAASLDMYPGMSARGDAFRAAAERHFSLQ